MLGHPKKEAEPEVTDYMDEAILTIILEYMQEEHLLTKEETNRFCNIWRKER